MVNKLWIGWSCFWLFIFMIIIQLVLPSQGLAAGATTSLHLVKYAADGTTILAEKTVDYQWMEKNLPVYGDGKTHYYHQGPAFEGDLWDPAEVNNLKDKGAVKGTAVKDLCQEIGGMSANDEIMLVSVDQWHTEFAYQNIYEPMDSQGVIALCWYNGEETVDGERYGVGYPSNNGYQTAMQIVFMSPLINRDGKHVFGNTDMKTALPQEKYQHFFEGQYPSTNGLSGKWISEVRIYSGGVTADAKVELPQESHGSTPEQSFPWIPVLLGLAGLLLVAWYVVTRRKTI